MTKSQFLVQNYSKLYQNSQKSYIFGLKWVKVSILPQLYHYYSPPPAGLFVEYYCCTTCNML